LIHFYKSSCSCGCGDVQCNDLQDFNQRSCSCICKNSSIRGQCMAQYNKIWDEESCSCRCRPEEWKRCNTGYEYDGTYTCQCLPGQPVSASLGVLVTLVVIIIVLIVCVVGLGIMLRRSKQREKEKLLAANRDLTSDTEAKETDAFNIEYEAPSKN